MPGGASCRVRHPDPHSEGRRERGAVGVRTELFLLQAGEP